MKNKDIKKAKELGLIPLTNLEQATEVWGIGWNGNFQKGIIKGEEVKYVYFEQEMGGVKGIEHTKGCVKFDKKWYYPFRTVHSELYYKPLS